MSIKMYSVKYSANITWMINYLHGIYKVNAVTNCQRRASLFNRFALYTEIVFYGCVFLYCLTAIGYLVYPIYMYVYESEIVAILPTYLPGINEKTPSGFIILTCYQLTLLIATVIGAGACDIMFTMLIANTPVMAKLIKAEVELLNDALSSEKVDKLLVRSRFRNMLLMHREMTE